MKDLGFRFSGLAIGLVLLVGLARWHNISDARSDLYNEVQAYHEKASESAAHIAFRLMKPHLDAETRGRFLQRFDVLEKAYFFPHDSYQSVTADLCGGEDFWFWVMKWAREAGVQNPHDHEALIALVHERTPVQQVGALSYSLHRIDSLTYQFNGEDPPNSMAEIEEARQKFITLKGEMERLLAQHESVANGLP